MTLGTWVLREQIRLTKENRAMPNPPPNKNKLSNIKLSRILLLQIILCRNIKFHQNWPRSLGQREVDPDSQSDPLHMQPKH